MLFRSKKNKEDGVNVHDVPEDVEEDRFGIFLEVFAEPFADSYFLSTRQLKIMSSITKAIAVWNDAKLLLLWASKMEEECGYEDGNISKLGHLSECMSPKGIDVVHAAAIIRSML